MLWLIRVWGVGARFGTALADRGLGFRCEIWCLFRLRVRVEG